jgi:hypothetical protein
MEAHALEGLSRDSYRTARARERAYFQTQIRSQRLAAGMTVALLFALSSLILR